MKPIQITLISFIVTALIVGGGTYYFINAKATKDKSNLQSQITDLNKKLTDTQAIPVASSNPTMSNSNNPTNVTLTTKITPLVVPTGYKLYTNTLYGYSFVYPLNHSIITNDAAAPTDTSGMVTATPGTNALIDTISYVKAMPNLKLTKSSLESSYNSFPQGTTLITTSVTIGGSNGYEIDYDTHDTKGNASPTGSVYYVGSSKGTVLIVMPEFASGSSRSGANGLQIINKYFKLTN